MELPLDGRLALVTGGGRGIGRATAERLAAAGAMVIVCARTESELKETVSEITRRGGRARYIVADLGDPANIRSVAAGVIKEDGPIDILINNASLLGPRVSLERYPLEDWEEVLRVNLTGLFVLTQECLKSMRPRGSGCIINLTSSVGRKGRAEWGAYAVSKFGVEGLTQTLADDLRGGGIRVMAINPGGTRTRMRAAAYPDEDPASLKPPEAVADAIVSLVCNDDPALSGRSFDFDAVPEKRGMNK